MVYNVHGNVSTHTNPLKPLVAEEGTLRASHFKITGSTPGTASSSTRTQLCPWARRLTLGYSNGDVNAESILEDAVDKDMAVKRQTNPLTSDWLNRTTASKPQNKHTMLFDILWQLKYISISHTDQKMLCPQAHVCICCIYIQSKSENNVILTCLLSGHSLLFCTGLSASAEIIPTQWEQEFFKY